ncbi:hypothetical protein EBT16_10680 [bacterium]|nr:hypothetical protein [bacterium]
MLLLVFLVVVPAAFSAEEKPHSGDSAEGKKSSPRATAEKKKPSTLAEKISACLNERPGTSTAKPETDSTKPEPKPEESVQAQSANIKLDGAPLFQQYCARCHSGGVTPGAAVGKVSGGLMPPPDEPQPSAAEKQALIEYFSGKK